MDPLVCSVVMFCSWFKGLLTCGLCSNDTVVDKLRVGLVGLVGWSGWVDLTGVASMAVMGRVVAAVSWVVDVEKSNTSVDVVVVGAVNSKGMGLAGMPGGVLLCFVKSFFIAPMRLLKFNPMPKLIFFLFFLDEDLRIFFFLDAVLDATVVVVSIANIVLLAELATGTLVVAATATTAAAPPSFVPRRATTGCTGEGVLLVVLMVVPVSAMMDMMAYGLGEPRLVADPRLRRFLLLVEVLFEVPSKTKLRLAPVRGAGVAFSSLVVVVVVVATVGLEARTLAAAALASVA